MSESLDLLLAALRSVGAVTLLLLLPGLTLGRVLAPGATTPLGALGRAAGVSLLTTSLACTLLAVAGVLRPVPVIAVVAGLTLAPILAGGLRLPDLRRGRTRIGWLAAGLGVVALLLMVVVPSRATVGDSLVPYTSTVWYYGALSDRMAGVGAIPATFPEWGGERAFHTDYLPFTAHAAAAFQLLPGDLMARMEVYRLGVVLAAGLVAALLFRRWVSTWLAVLAAILLLATERLAFKFLAFKPETFGLVLALFALWAFDRAIVERSTRLAGLAVVASTATFLVHAEVFLVLAAAAAGVAAARAIVSTRRGSLVGLRMPQPRAAARALAVAAAMVSGGAVVGAAVNGIIAGELRLVGYVTGDRGPEAPPARLEVAPPGWTFTDDPTWDFYVAAVAPGQLGRSAPASFTDPRLLPRAIAHVWPGLDGRNPSLLVVLVGLVAIPILSWPWLDARRRRLLVIGLVFGAALLVGSYLLFAISDTYVPRRVGPRRLMPYELLVPVVSAVIVLWGLDRLLRPGWRTLLSADGRPSRAATVVAAGALALVTAGMVAPAPSLGEDDAEPRGRLSAVGVEAWRWIAANTPADARILVNAYTDGVVPGLGRRIGIVDGRAVYLEDPAFLAESTELLLGARTLFLDPAGAQADAYLQENRVSHVLVADTSRGADGSDVGGYLPFVTEVDALAGGGRYTLLRSFGDGRVRLYGVATGG